MKRTTFMVDEALLEEAKITLGAKNYSEALDIALREAIRVKKVMNLTSYFGKDLWNGDLTEMREDRPHKPLARRAVVGK
jgi:Arc/MetJ family transcription regulator